jgi:hypothetical protein
VKECFFDRRLDLLVAYGGKTSDILSKPSGLEGGGKRSE